MSKIERDSMWFHLFQAALQGTAVNIFLSKEKIVRKAIAIADEATRQLK